MKPSSRVHVRHVLAAAIAAAFALPLAAQAKNPTHEQQLEARYTER